MFLVLFYPEFHGILHIPVGLPDSFYQLSPCPPIFPEDTVLSSRRTILCTIFSLQAHIPRFRDSSRASCGVPLPDRRQWHSQPCSGNYTAHVPALPTSHHRGTSSYSRRHRTADRSPQSDYLPCHDRGGCANPLLLPTFSWI